MRGTLSPCTVQSRCQYLLRIRRCQENAFAALGNLWRHRPASLSLDPQPHLRPRSPKAVTVRTACQSPITRESGSRRGRGTRPFPSASFSSGPDLHALAFVCRFLPMSTPKLSLNPLPKSRQRSSGHSLPPHSASRRVSFSPLFLTPPGHLWQYPVTLSQALFVPSLTRLIPRAIPPFVQPLEQISSQYPQPTGILHDLATTHTKNWASYTTYITCRAEYA